MTILFLLGELVILFFISQRLTENLFGLILRITRSRPIAISLVTLLLFPGTVLHELSHLFTAEILGVRTGKLTLAPEAIRGDEIQAGSVAIAQTGPFRRVMIGLAPLLWGLGVSTACAYFLWNPPAFVDTQIPLLYWQLAMFYLLFALSNSLFPSSLDMQGTPGPIISVLLLLAAAYVAGIRLSLPGQSLEVVSSVIYALTQSLGVVLAVNAFLLLTIHGLIVLTGKITGKRAY